MIVCRCSAAVGCRRLPVACGHHAATQGEVIRTRVPATSAADLATFCIPSAMTTEQEYLDIPDAACCQACVSSGAWAAALAVADIIEGMCVRASASCVVVQH
jgi:hypothetical protein